MQTDTKALTRDIHLKAPLTFPDGAAPGSFLVRFSVYNEVDSDGDVVLAGAIANGQETPVVWAHLWGGHPVAKGVTETDDTGANLRGQFFMDTWAGEQAYRTIKNMGALQEYSWGFRVTDAEFGELNGKSVRFIKATELYEVSPVLVGANRNTGTLVLKGDKPSTRTKALDGSFEDIAEDVLALALDAIAALPDENDPGGSLYGPGMTTDTPRLYGYVVATFADHVIVCVSEDGDPDQDYYDVPYMVNAGGGEAAGEITIGTPTPVELTYTPVAPGKAASHGIATKAPAHTHTPEPFAAHIERVLLELRALTARAKGISDLRAKSGRTFSAANVDTLSTMADEAMAHGHAMTAHGQAIHDMLAAAAPGKSAASSAGIDPHALYLAFQEIEFHALEHERARIGG